MFFDKKNDEEFYDWESYKAARNQAEVTEASEENDESENYSLDSHIKTLGVLIIAVLACLTLVFAVKYNQAQKRIKQLEAERFDMIHFFLTVEETDEDERYWEADDDDFIEERKIDNFDYEFEPESPEPPVHEIEPEPEHQSIAPEPQPEPRPITPEPPMPLDEEPDTPGPSVDSHS